MSHFKDKMHQIRFLASVRPSLRWSLTHNGDQEDLSWRTSVLTAQWP